MIETIVLAILSFNPRSDLDTTKEHDGAIVGKLSLSKPSILDIISTNVDPLFSMIEDYSITITNLKALFLLKISELVYALVISCKLPLLSNIPGRSKKFIPFFL